MREPRAASLDQRQPRSCGCGARRCDRRCPGRACHDLGPGTDEAFAGSSGCGRTPFWTGWVARTFQQTNAAASFTITITSITRSVRTPLRRRWSALATGQVPAIIFWFRQSPQYLVASGMSPRLYPGRVTPLDPSPSLPGITSVNLDPSGRLIEFIQAPERQLASPPVSKEVDFKPLFEEAKLDWLRADENHTEMDSTLLCEPAVCLAGSASGRAG